MCDSVCAAVLPHSIAMCSGFTAQKEKKDLGVFKDRQRSRDRAVTVVGNGRERVERERSAWAEC